MNLYDGPPMSWYDPPEDHLCFDRPDCETCHEFHISDGSFDYAFCVICQDYLDWQISLGRRCQHFEEAPRQGGSWCEQCEDFYLKLNLTGETDEQ